MKNFIVVSAPSGAGKTTLCRELQRRQPELLFSLSCTTRPRRSIETDGVDYSFISEEKFNAMVAADEFAEHEEVHGYQYGTPKKILDETIAGNQRMLFEVDVKGAMSIKRLYPERTISIFILPPDVETLRERLLLRGTDSPERIQKRLERMAIEIGYQDKFEYTVVNDDIDRATAELIKIISQ
ncbi:MAG: guanylate kinase [Candidatus Neomarinimicrobiota bacterium]